MARSSRAYTAFGSVWGVKRIPTHFAPRICRGWTIQSAAGRGPEPQRSSQYPCQLPVSLSHCRISRATQRRESGSASTVKPAG